MAPPITIHKGGYLHPASHQYLRIPPSNPNLHSPVRSQVSPFPCSYSPLPKDTENKLETASLPHVHHQSAWSSDQRVFNSQLTTCISNKTSCSVILSWVSPIHQTNTSTKYACPLHGDFGKRIPETSRPSRQPLCCLAAV